MLPENPTAIFTAPVLLILLIASTGCESGMSRIDREVGALLYETTEGVGGGATPPSFASPEDESPFLAEDRRDLTDEHPGTVNPSAGDLPFTARVQQDTGNYRDDARVVMDRLEAYNRVPEDSRRMDLAVALAYSVQNSREFRYAEEEYILSALRLLTERHRWGPRFFDEVSADIFSDGDEGFFDTSLQLVNELRVTQRLPYGGEVSARALARATEDLHNRVSGADAQSAEFILGANIPLLRGAGDVARENLIQAERNLIYGARIFERYKRDFLFDITQDYLDLVVALQRIDNAERGVQSYLQLQAQQEALLQAGRNTPFDAAEAENRALDAVDDLNGARESYRLSVDRFKVRIGMSVEQYLVVERTGLALPTPAVTMDQAVYAGITNRLDLQTRRDQLDDARRAVKNARNQLLGDLDLTASVNIPTDDDQDRQELDFEFDDADFRVGVTYGLPLDREIERLALRQSQISLERALREYDRFRDDIALSVRAAVRGIDSALFSLQIQEANVEIAEMREASIEADPDRADIRQKTDAIDQTARARNSRDSARRDLEVAVLFFLLETGQLRVNDDGYIMPLEGMEIGEAGQEDEESSATEGG